MKTTRKQIPELLSAREVADAFRCSPSVVYAMARQGKIPRVRLGGLIRFRAADIEAVVVGASEK